MRRFLIGALLGVVALAQPAIAQPPGPSAEALVAGWYARFLNRRPDAFAGSWVAALREGQSPEAVLSQLLGSPEYLAKGGGTSEGFLQTLYRDVVGRPPLPQEMGYWLPRMAFMPPGE